MQLACCTSLTLLSCADLRCSFDLRVVVNVEAERRGCAEQKPDAERLLSPVQRLRSGGLSQNSIRAVVGVRRHGRRKREVRIADQKLAAITQNQLFNLEDAPINMGLITDEENLQPLHQPPASRRLRWWFEPQLLHKYAFYCGSCRGFIMFFNGRLAAVCTLRFHNTNCCK